MSRSDGTHLPTGVGVNRMRHAGRLAQEANAFGNAEGYADVRTGVWQVKGGVGVKTCWTRCVRWINGRRFAGQKSSEGSLSAKSAFTEPHSVGLPRKSAGSKNFCGVLAPRH